MQELFASLLGNEVFISSLIEIDGTRVALFMTSGKTYQCLQYKNKTQQNVISDNIFYKQLH